MADTRKMFKITKDLHEQLKRESDKTKIPMIYLIEKAWEAYKNTKKTD